jgi:hypothetical protein
LPTLIGPQAKNRAGSFVSVSTLIAASLAFIVLLIGG